MRRHASFPKPFTDDADLMTSSMTLTTLIVSVGTTGSAVLLGICVACWLVTRSTRTQRFGVGVCAMGLLLPPFLVCNAWMELFGHAGKWSSFLPFSIYGIDGTILIGSLMLWPIVTLLLYLAWRRIPRAVLESDARLLNWQLFKHVLLPIGRNNLVLGVCIVFAHSLSNYSIPALLQVKTLSADLWVRYAVDFDVFALILGSVPLLLPAGILVWKLACRQAREQLHERGKASPELWRRRLGLPMVRVSEAVSILALTFSVGLPLGVVLFSPTTWTEFSSAAASNGAVMRNSFCYALVGAIGSVVLGLSWIRFSGERWGLLSFWIPGTAIGASLLFVFNRPGLSPVSGSMAIVFIALAVRFGGVCWFCFRRALASLPQGLIEQPRLFRGKRWRTVLFSVIPLMHLPISGLLFLIYLLSLWEVEVLSLIYPPGGESAAIRVFNFLHYGHNGQVNAVCLMLLLMGLGPLLIVWVVRRGFRAFGTRCLAVGGAVLLSGCGSSREGSEIASLESQFFSHAELIGGRGRGPGQFSKPRSLTVDLDDNLYVIDITGRVQKFSPEGVYLGFWQMPEIEVGKPKGMCLDRAGHVVLAEPHYARVNHFNGDGDLLNQWGDKGTGAGHITFPRAVASLSNGDMIVSEYAAQERVQIFSADGRTHKGGWGRRGMKEGEFNRPEGLAVDQFDRVYVADSCNHRIQVFDADGQFLKSMGRAGLEAGEMSYPYDLEVLPSGLIIVCEFGNSRIQILNALGESIETIGEAGGELGQFSNPWGTALDSRGNLYVADSANHRVQKLVARDGAFERSSSSSGMASTELVK